ncbi:response regulator [Candidatus Magnetominusculus xianensis]|uniref:Chemotaxis protein CheY n=1 Tax=Candidatus Magnetominusculus xianensis TaxID=1748249 RepID=A0ABR5SB83_9BACT|nr:response regulator [Candidatus Magnetominusculus xianensis]KWT76799.1 chemotaxis protein CheY [Candidatus Magnetominusculus xianensis]MBF0402695.1 response regulator [Nitrospirota bacterium]
MILIISFYRSLQKDLEAYLKANFPDIEIDKAYYDVEGIKKIDSDITYELIISDWDSGYVDGLKILKKVRENPVIKETPFVILTEKQDKESVLACVKAAVTGYIMKPALSQTIDEKTFYEKLRPFIEKIT